MAYKLDLYLLGLRPKNVDPAEFVKTAWESGRDFQIVGGPACSIRDFDELKKLADRINLRYLGNEHYEYIRIWTHPLAGVTTYV